MSSGTDLSPLVEDRIQNRTRKVELQDPFAGSEQTFRAPEIPSFGNKEDFLNKIRRDMGVLAQREDFRERAQRRRERENRLKNITLD